MKARVLCGIGMAIITVPLVILGNPFFTIYCGFLGILGLRELIDLKIHHKKIPYFMIGISFIDLLFLIFSEFDSYNFIFGLSYSKIAFVLLSLFLPCLFYKEEKYTAHEAIYLSGSILLLGIVFNSLILIRNNGIWYLIYLTFIPMLTDIFAMFIGRLIGKNKCAPIISPKKTWEGTIGGLIVSVFICTLLYQYKIGKMSILISIGVTSLFSIVGQLSDLLFSKIKRENKIKDFSNLIPGHGGILDRLDSLVFVVLVYILLYSYI